jgi:hypothetical protein
MFQRIQTLCLAITLVGMAAMLFLPYASLTDGEGAFLNFYPFKVVAEPVENNPFLGADASRIPAMILGIGMVACLVALASFKKRKLQERLVFYVFTSNILYLAAGFIVMLKTAPGIQGHWLGAFGWLPAILHAVLLVIAVRGIRKDEALIKSYDRLR